MDEVDEVDEMDSSSRLGAGPSLSGRRYERPLVAGGGLNKWPAGPRPLARTVNRSVCLINCEAALGSSGAAPGELQLPPGGSSPD